MTNKSINIKKRKFNYFDEIMIFFIFVASRIPFLGHEIFNTDVWKWKARSYDFSSGVFFLDFAKTLQRYHPGVILMWIGTASIKIHNFIYESILGVPVPDNDIGAIFQLHFIQKLLVVIVTGLTLAVIYYALKNVISRKYAVLAILFLLIEPFYLALNRIFHLEGLMSSFLIASFVWLVFYLKDINIKSRLYISAIFAGLAVLTKTSSLFIVPFAGLVLFLHYYLERPKFALAVKTSLSHYWKWFLAFFAVFVVLWPAVWVIPGEVFATLYRGIFSVGLEEGHLQIFLGQETLDPGILFYPLVFLYKVSPFLIVGLIGVIVFARKNYNRNSKRFMLYALLFSLLYLVALVLSSKKLDRYLLPTILGLSLISTFFYDWLITKYKDLGKVIFASTIGIWVIFLVSITPDYLSYYSFLGGGLQKGMYVIEPKWLIGANDIQKYFKNVMTQENLTPFEEGESFKNSNNLSTKLIVVFPEKYYTQIWPFIREIGGWSVINSLTPEAVKANFAVYPVWEDTSIEEDRFKLDYHGSIEIRGVPAYNVYRIIK